MSPVLFGIFIDELLQGLKRSQIGVKLGARTLSCLGFADDIMILSENGEDLQKLLNICNDYGREWKMKFSETKCKIMIFTGQLLRH